MRKSILSALLIISLAGFGQKKDSVSVKDSVTTTTPLASISDYDAFVKEVVQDMPAKYADVVRQWWIERLQAIIAKRKK